MYLLCFFQHYGINKFSRKIHSALDITPKQVTHFILLTFSHSKMSDIKKYFVISKVEYDYLKDNADRPHSQLSQSSVVGSQASPEMSSEKPTEKRSESEKTEIKGRSAAGYTKEETFLSDGDLSQNHGNFRKQSVIFF